MELLPATGWADLVRRSDVDRLDARIDSSGSEQGRPVIGSNPPDMPSPRRLVALFAALLACLALVAPATVHASAPPTTSIPSQCQAVPDAAGVYDCVVPVPEEVGSVGAITTTVRVLVPSGYDGITELPVVYLLHGAGDTYRTWVQNTDVETFAHALDALVVMPDGGCCPESGWYSDWRDGSRRYETFHIEVLIPWVDAAFATLADRDHRAVMGLSMGGFGAVSYAGRHPHVFSAAASFSGLLDTQMTGPAEGYAFAGLHGEFGTPDDRVWGDPTLDMAEWSAHNPAALARDGKLQHLDGNLWLTTGTGTPGGPAGDDPSNPGAYGVEHFIWHTNNTFRANAVASGTAFHDLSYLGGAHDWEHWQHALHLVLPSVVDAIS